MKFIKKYWKYILFLIISYAIFLRLYNLWIQSFWIDEGFSSYVSKQFFKNWIDFTKPEYFLHNISQLLSFKIFGISDFAARFPSVIFSALNIPLIYLISINLFNDKKQAILSTLIFSFLTWEIIWARQARFYTLLQLLFTLNIYLTIKVVKDFSLKYLYLGILFLYIWILFHPFLYSNVVLFILSIIYLLFLNYKKIDFKNINYKKYLLIILPFLVIFIIEITKKILTDAKWISIPWTFELPDFIKKQRFPKYYSHVYSQLGLLLPISLIWMLFFVFKRKVLESIIFTFATVFIFYIIAYKGKMFHTRYVLILYPLFIISGSYLIVYIYNLIKDEFIKYAYAGLIAIIIFSTWAYTFIPKTKYFIDYTSPQPNFKEAYNSIPKWQEIISGFPMLCEWYYKKKWKCLYSLPINYVWDKNLTKKILERWKDNYTNIKYLLDSKQLAKNKTYFFVLDNLTISRMIDRKLLKEILHNSKLIYYSWKEYNRIIVLKYKK